MSRTSLIELFLVLAVVGLAVAVVALLALVTGLRSGLLRLVDTATYATLTSQPPIRWWCANCKRHTPGAWYCGECGAMRP